MPIDCSNPTNSLGATAASPWIGIEAVKSDYNSWVAYISEVNGLLNLASDRLTKELLPEMKAKGDKDGATLVVKLVVKISGFRGKTQFIDPAVWPSFTNKNQETLKLRDLAVDGCGLLEQAGIWLRKYGDDIDYGNLDTWEDARKKGPPGWRSIVGWGAVVVGSVAVLGAVGYALTAVASARRAGGPRAPARRTNGRRTNGQYR